MSNKILFNGEPLPASLAAEYSLSGSGVDQALIDFFALEELDRQNKELKIINKELEKKCHTDFLTGLPNRLACVDNLKEIAGIKKRDITRRQSTGLQSDSSLSSKFEDKRKNNDTTIYFLDLNKFKIINDTLGHQVGDEVLKDVGKQLSEHLRRATTKLYRMGGDEFVVVEQLTNPDGAKKTIEHIQAFFKDYSFEHEGKEWPVGTSIGHQIYDESLSVEDNIAKADKAMYVNKESNPDSRPPNDEPPSLT